MLRQELIIIMKGCNFWIAVVVMFLCFCGFSIPYWTAYDLPIEYMPSALHLSVGGIFFGGVMLLIPFCSAFVCVENQSDEIRTSFFQWAVFRCSCIKYSVCKLSAALLGGAIAVMLAFGVHALLWHFIALPYNPSEYPEQCFLCRGNALLSMAAEAICMADIPFHEYWNRIIGRLVGCCWVNFLYMDFR